ncbi:MAG: RdgB/HAM1 family non-canonical purine NTP pyrophosphatase, partial [Oscillospiraceae bacterium]
MQFVAATNNKGKLKEIKRILEKMGHTVKSQGEMGITLEPEENGTTFEANALIKAKAICEVCNLPTVADDSGIEVDFLHGEPGVLTARYAGVHGDDEANNDKLLLVLEGVLKENRTAKFVSTVCVYLPDGRHLTTRGECAGYIGFERRGNNGFGYDPIFNVPFYGDKSYAELTDDEKDVMSHRG